MIVATHAAIGAAVGTLFKSKGGAFLAGIVSHAPADLLPHQEYCLWKEVALLGMVLGYIGARHGPGSPCFWGALGAAAPDLENGLAELGLLKERHKVFPTHHKPWHGRETEETLSQALIVMLCLYLAWRRA